jgi:hyaluronan synthase
MHSQVLLGVLALPRLSTAHLGQLRHLIPLGFVGLISWSVWLLRVTLSRVYRSVSAGFTATTSVVVPSYREDPLILERCLSSWLAEGPDEVIVVPDLFAFPGSSPTRPPT